MKAWLMPRVVRNLTPVVLAAMLVIVLAACSLGHGRPPAAEPERDADQKRFVPSAGSARIYVYRQRSNFWGRYDNYVFVDGQPVGAIGPGQYTSVDVGGGERVVLVETHLTWKGQERVIATAHLPMTANSGESYFVRIDVATFWPSDPPKLTVIEQAEGKNAIKRCRLAR